MAADGYIFRDRQRARWLSELAARGLPHGDGRAVGEARPARTKVWLANTAQGRIGEQATSTSRYVYTLDDTDQTEHRQVNEPPVDQQIDAFDIPAGFDLLIQDRHGKFWRIMSRGSILVNLAGTLADGASVPAIVLEQPTSGSAPTASGRQETVYNATGFPLQAGGPYSAFAAQACQDYMIFLHSLSDCTGAAPSNPTTPGIP